MRYEIPIPEDLVDELIPFWESIFGEGPPDIVREVFLGSEETHNRVTLYLKREGQKTAGTCAIVQSKTVPALAGFGEVATDPEFRGRGIATDLCRRAVEDFRSVGGQAFFLGTVNPDAARIYHRLGWRKLAGANLMANITSGESPEAFLVDYFRCPSEVTVDAAGSDVRVPMIPLIWTPHDDQVLDANVGLYSRRYDVQGSCMGLYPRYVRELEGRGAFFAGRTKDGRVVGLSSAVLEGEGMYRIDGFVHHNFSEAWIPLLETARSWGTAEGATHFRARVSVEDEDKRARFESMAFKVDASGESFTIGGRSVKSTWLTSG